MRDFFELVSIYADDIIATIIGIIALVVLIGGMAWLVHSDINGPCTHTLAGERCAVIDTSPQR